MKDAKRNLGKARIAKQDEFYTRMSDIEKELEHYAAHFEGKVVYCNCDDPDRSNFWKYFEGNFDRLGLKRLVSTHYAPQGKSSKRERIGGHEDPCTTPLEGNGDFRSGECIDLMEQADIVVTNPPFSLFREYVAQLVEHGKKFLIIGNQNAITCKDIFALIKDGKLWLGWGFKGGAAHFTSPYEDRATASNHIEGMVRVPGVNWFTNLDHKKRHEDIILYKTHNPEEYPKYDNYDAINVDKIKDIPMDYFGAMGVPITFLNKFNSAQFEIVKIRKGDDGRDLTCDGRLPYNRIIIIKKTKETK
jgi:hypothetical protein